MFGSTKLELPTADEALPGRDTPMAIPDDPLRQRPPAGAALPRGHESWWSAWAASGAPSGVLVAAGRVGHRGRLRRRHHAQPDLRGGVLGPHRPHRGGAGGVRSRRRSATRRCSRCSGRATTPPRACARATTSAPSTARPSTPTDAGAAEAAERVGRGLRPSAGRRGLRRRSPPRSPRPPPFYFAEGYHQQYLAKNPNGYCGLGGTGVSCPIGLATAE